MSVLCQRKIVPYTDLFIKRAVCAKQTLLQWSQTFPTDNLSLRLRFFRRCFALRLCVAHFLNLGFDPLPPTRQSFSPAANSNFLSRLPVRKDRRSFDLIGVRATNPWLPSSHSRDQLGMCRAKTNRTNLWCWQPNEIRCSSYTTYSF